MNIGADQAECGQTIRLEKLSFNKFGAKLRKLSQQSDNFFIKNENIFKNFLGKRNYQNVCEEDEILDFDQTNKQLKISDCLKPRREYFDLRSFYQSGKGSVQIKNLLFNDEISKRENDQKMTKSVQKIDYSLNKNFKSQKFISPLKITNRNNDKIKEFNPKILNKTNQLFDKTPSRKEDELLEKEKKQNGIKCDLCEDRSKYQFFILLDDNVDMLKCGHIVCLNCILREEMTYSDCKICQGNVCYSPKKQESPDFRENKLVSESVKVVSVRDLNLEQLGFKNNYEDNSDVEVIEKPSVVNFF